MELDLSPVPEVVLPKTLKWPLDRHPGVASRPGLTLPLSRHTVTYMAAPSWYDPRSEVKFSRCVLCGKYMQGKLHWGTGREGCLELGRGEVA
jgi:hypothetical protein